jgi:hypothetical protein
MMCIWNSGARLRKDPWLLVSGWQMDREEEIAKSASKVSIEASIFRTNG